MGLRALATLAVWMGLQVVAQAATPPFPTLRQLVTSLQNRPECVVFRWERAAGQEHAAISMPVFVNGVRLQFQLDTGADYDVVYGNLPSAHGWSSPTARSFRPALLQIGSTRVVRPLVTVKSSLDGEGLAGTLGLNDLVGRVAVIDYHDQRFCLFDDADAPDSVRAAATVSAVLRDGKLFVPVVLGKRTLDAVIFDTGSSALPLLVDLSRWQQLTGIENTTLASREIKGSSWGKPITIKGAPTRVAAYIGSIPVGNPDVYTLPGAPDNFANWPFRTEALIGNALFLGGAVILDISAQVKFGFVR